MENLENIIKNYIFLLEEKNGLDIIVNDNYNLLFKSKLEDLPQINRWHYNPYCLKIKSNSVLHNKCVTLKKNYNRILCSEGKGVYFNLYCGVGEYAVPIMIQGVHFCTVSVTGIKGKINDNMMRLLSERVKLSASELCTIHQQNLKTMSEKELSKLKIEIDALAFLFYEYYKSLPNIGAYISKKNNEEPKNYITTAIDYIDINYNRKLTVNEIAEHCYISTSYLKHIFKKTVGISVTEQIKKKRMEKSCELLCATKHSIKFIAFSVGFENPDYFSAVFTDYYKISPLRYRKKYSLYN